MANQLQEGQIFISFQHSFDTSQSFLDGILNKFNYRSIAFEIMPEGCKPILAIKVKSLKGSSND